MSIATNPWSDTNRFNQTGYSASTLFPKPENYKSIEAYEEDYLKAEKREQDHQEFLEELREEYRQEQYCERYGCNEEEE